MPLPPGQPGVATAASVGVSESGDQIDLIVIGDHGGVVDPTPQRAVAWALERELAGDRPAFIYSVGDLVYFNGDATQYAPQFYEPYASVAVPFVGIPGNHDGDPDPTIADSSLTGIATFMQNFCAAAPAPPPADPDLEYGRHTQTQPYCDWVLALDAATIVGVWSNVPDGGYLYSSQREWLAAQLRVAPSDRPLAVALHHPPLSVDSHHGGSATMLAALDTAFTDADRTPALVICGHVHDYQRFTRTFPGTTRQIVYMVSGNGGYHNLHPLAADATPGLDVLGDGSVIFEAGDGAHFGYVRMRVSATGIAATYMAVTPGALPDLSDTTVTTADVWSVTTTG